MRAEILKRDKRYDVDKSSAYAIQTYGEDNAYPQNIIEILSASVTGASCVRRYADFVSGKGFLCKDIDGMAANHEESFGMVLRKVVIDYTRFGGFALLVNYNANFKISTVYSVPFEHVRLGLPDDNGLVHDYALHPDWGRRNSRLHRFDSEDIVRIHAFEPTEAAIAQQVIEAGGFELFKGQLLYYSNNGDGSYPLPIFDSVVTDMNTEEGISNITNRNARNNFLPSGMLVDICHVDQSDDEENATENLLRQYQGDVNALKLMYAQVESREEVPEFVEFKSQNYDKEYTESRKSVIDNIGRAFNQPPVIRAEQTNSGFSTTEMVAAYNYYNSVTTQDRYEVQRVFNRIFAHWWLGSDYDATIEPLSYDVQMSAADRLGNNLQPFLNIVADMSMALAQKRGLARALFGLDEATINQILPL